MIRQASAADLNGVEEGYKKHFSYEKKYGAFTVFKEGVYPTRQHAEKALSHGELYVYEKDKIIAGSMILTKTQPEEYKNIDWSIRAAANRVMVINLIMVRPDMAGNGIGSSLVCFAARTAKHNSCEVLRLHTRLQNIPAVSLYKKLGFLLAGSAEMNVGGVISHVSHLFFEKLL